MTTSHPDDLAEVLRAHAAVRADHPALIFEGRSTSYRDLDEAASKVANGLLSINSVIQTRVAVLAKNSDRFFEIVFGIIKSRNVICALNWRLSARELSLVLQDAEVRVIFVGEDYLSLLEAISSHGAKLEHVFVIGNGGSSGYIEWRDRQPAEDPHLAADLGDVFWQLYTSGTTGMPKAVQLTQFSAMQMRTLDAGVGAPWASPGPDSRTLIAMPNFHLGGTGWAFMFLHHGASLIIQAQVSASEMVTAVEESGITHLFVAPTILQMMIDVPGSESRDFSSVKFVYYGSSPISPALLKVAMQRFQSEFVQIYGMTETNGFVSFLSPQDHDLSRPELLKSCGKPYPGVDMRVLDSSGHEVPTGEVGEICILTPCLMKGYWKRPDFDRECMHGRFYRSGDAGYKDPQGYFFLVDRIKDMIVSGGENVYPIEVERVLAEHPAVLEAAVIGVPDPRWGEAVKAIVVRRSETVTSQTLIEFVKARIAGYKTPKTIDFVDALPRNPAGKILKRELREPYWRDVQRRIG